ncbi:hypothetical protein EW093_14270 [Thiospirochaeta perfilievii]|uniref:Flagellar protein FlgN n=1 Tax=Thiospirochaeta perfilievii TaxID=252967 RepID=A0A5C1QEJ6_9SPIO|nr:hypothetical protein [Thiospirochaeta perfilievii]QEN05817.1 hypothetical protein EW093_14270 [Thiospirochaeta perfilievii]
MNSDNFIDLKENMENQVTVFERVIHVNDFFKQSILDRDWGAINKNIDLLNELAFEVNRLDVERVDILISITKVINSKESENLLTLIHKSPKEMHESLFETFYKLKNAIIQVKGVFKGLDNYVQHRKEVSKEVIDILVKDAKGNVYSKPGRRDLDGQGFLVNKQL